ncbi:MAG: orotate phosphoribosyltransferase [Candidatus Micrarchaeota archaeon]|nr:orotate phosphoribosyltransferase [Candidatus Micrarchaeota archaeon]
MVNTEFIEFLAKSGAVKFGEFTLKSGRQSPFFISTGVLCDGTTSYELGKHYARKITEVYKDQFSAIFGPAYKGIPLAVSVSIALQKEFSINRCWMFDRKEKKTHGDASSFVGPNLDLGSKFIIVDDVMTTGETKLEAVEKITNGLKGEVIGIIIAVDRQEKRIKLNATEEFTEKTGIPVHSITTIKEIFDHLLNRNVDGKVYVDGDTYAAFTEYRKKYGI